MYVPHVWKCKKNEHVTQQLIGIAYSIRKCVTQTHATEMSWSHSKPPLQQEKVAIHVYSKCPFTAGSLAINVTLFGLAM